METNDFIYTKLNDMSLEMQTQSDKNMTLLHGKALLNETESRFIFMQNKPRGPRSIEVGRSEHCRLVRRPDGLYTLTFRFDSNEKYVSEQLLTELRNIVRVAKEDNKECRTQKTKK